MKANPKAYNEFLTLIQGFNINLQKLELSNSGIKGRDFIAHYAYNTRWDKQITPEKLTVYFDVHLICLDKKFELETSSFKEVIEVTKKNSKTVPNIQIKFTFILNYIIKSENLIENDIIKIFVKNNLPVNVWPYARELVSSLSIRMGEVPLMLPPLFIQ